MKKITVSILVLFFCINCFLSNAQNVTATLGNVAGKNKGDTIRIPLYVKGFKNIGAFGLAIIIDTNVLTNIPGDSSCVTNIIAALKNGSNFFGSNFGSKVAIYWMYKGKWKDSIVTELKMAFSVSGMNGINIPDGKLLDLVFLYKGGIAPICFDTLLCEVDDNNINILPVTYNCGNIENKNYCQANYSIKNDTAQYTFDFSDQSLVYDVTGWKWNFGDSTSSTEQNPVHKFPTNGMYKVCLTITSTDSGKVVCTDTFCNYVDVEENIKNDCNAFFNVSYADSASRYSFTDKSIGNNISGWSWDFGDASLASLQQSPFHKYQKSGNYDVCLTIYSYKSGKLSCSDVYCENISVQTDTAIDKCMSVPYILQDSMPYTYDFYGYAAGDSITWSWDFGDGSHSSNRDTIHTYAKPGEYIACLTINSYSGGTLNCTDTYCQTIKIDSIANLPPNYCFNYFTYNITDTSKTNFNVSFTAYTKSNNPLYYYWNFGDGTKATKSQLPEISHTFVNKSVFNTCLETYPVSDSLLCEYTSCKDIFGYIDTIYSYGSISGQIYAGSNYADSGMVALIKLDSIYSGHISYFDVVKISTSGYYKFSNIPYGNYYVFAMLTPFSQYYMKYITAFYESTWNWENANTVFAGNNQASNNININLVALFGKKSIGEGCITGKIYDPDFKPGANTSYSYVEVILLDNNNKPVSFTYTDANGNYKFENLDYGTYEVYVMVIGLNIAHEQLTINSKAPCANNTDFIVDYLSTLPIGNYLHSLGINYFISQLTNAGTQISDIFPNPVSETANIYISAQYPVQSAQLSVEIYNQIGQKVASESYKYSSGTQTISFNTTGMSKGLYFVRISIDNTNAIRKFVKL